VILTLSKSHGLTVLSSTAAPVPGFHETLENKGNRRLKPPKMVQKWFQRRIGFSLANHRS